MIIKCTDYKSPEMQVLMHHIYEYKKGLRSLVLHTMSIKEQLMAEYLLRRKGIDFAVQKVNERKINVFFGNEQCVRIVRSFDKQSLSEFTDEQDFILGVMLGYDRNQQCDRYIKRKGIQMNNDNINNYALSC